MKVINLIFTKISASKNKNFKPSGAFINIKFNNVEKDSNPSLKDLEIFKIDFTHQVSYKKSNDSKLTSDAELALEGQLIISPDKEESKELLKSWKNKEVPSNIQPILYNAILKRCSIKALSLEEDLNLPFHIPLPKLASKTK